MDGPAKEGGCPVGVPGPEGWSSDKPILTATTRVENVHPEDGKDVRDWSNQILYIDRSRNELGIRTMAGGRVFVPLSDVLALLGKE